MLYTCSLEKQMIQRKMCIVWAVIVGICVYRNCAIYFSVYQAQLEYSIKLLEDYKNGTLPPGITDKELWEAQKIKQVWCPIKEQSYSRLALIESIFVKLQVKIYYPWWSINFLVGRITDLINRVYATDNLPFIYKLNDKFS